MKIDVLVKIVKILDLCNKPSFHPFFLDFYVFLSEIGALSIFFCYWKAKKFLCFLSILLAKPYYSY